MTAFFWALLKLAGICLPLAALAWWFRVFPTRKLVLLAIVPAVLTLLLLASEKALFLVVIADVVLACLLAADLATLPARAAFSVERAAGRILSLKKPHTVTLSVLNHTGREFDVTVRDGVDDDLCPRPGEFEETLPARSRLVLEYTLRARRRGAFIISAAHIRVGSRMGLWHRYLVYPFLSTIHVYPDMQQLGQYAMLARTDRLNLLGVRRTRRIGQDHDFERLRDYTIDDNYKHIDWRATARRRKLTVRDYQSSQSQRIIFLLDCGRMMTNQAAGLSLLDHGLNALLMLGYVALRQNDSVGLIAFSDTVHGYVPPRSGMNQMNRLLHASFDRFPSLVESRYDLAFRYLASHCRKRSLVVLITNVIDEVNTNQIERYLTNLVGRHLPLGVMLRDRSLFDAVDYDPQETPIAPAADKRFWRAAAAADILSWRKQVL
ncbi:MAG: DUF58 domain-containing protein, partial [Pirellulales bacterium]|nr:DUF58 domain-containing protein [Pirellulales bacterium]